MGYSSSRDNELKLVEEKKEDDCGTRDELEDREDRDERKRPPVAATASEGNANPEGEDEEEDSSDDDDDDDDVGADANENAAMLLQDPDEQQHQHQQQLQQLHQQHQLQQQQGGQQHALNFASSGVGMQSHLQSALAAQQQLLEHAVVAQHLQQTRLMTSSLSSLQLGAALQPAVLPVPAFAGSMALNPVAPNAAAVQYQIQQQQQVLAQQQAAAQAAALSIGAVTSSRALAAGGLGVPLGGQPTPPLGVPFAPGAPAMQPAAGMSSLAPLAPLGMNPVASAPLLAATGPLGAIAAATNPAAGLVPVAPAAPMTSGHHLTPQLTIPHYVPPIPPTWGAQVPALSVQDRPLVPPIYNGINPNYPGAQLLHAHPPIFAVENFLSPAECDFLIENANDAFGPAPVVGRGSGEVSPSRTSSTCYLAREDLPEYLRKVGLLTGKPAEHCELPQVGRYMPSQQYLQHFDAFDLSNDDGRRFAANGGQRTVTVLVYLNDVARGGSTAFPNLNLEVRPRRGMALVFFPSTLDGLLDRMALHAALPAVDVKYVSQVWIRQSNYEGRPSKRLAEPMLGGLQERREAQERAMMMGQAMQQQRLSAQHLHVQAQQMHQQQQMLQGQSQGREGYEQMNG